MTFVGDLLFWAVMFVCIYLAYLTIREVEAVLVRRPFSVLLTLVLVGLVAGLLLTAVDALTGSLLGVSTATDRGSLWFSLVSLALAGGAAVTIQRNVALR